MSIHKLAIQKEKKICIKTLRLFLYSIKVNTKHSKIELCFS